MGVWKIISFGDFNFAGDKYLAALGSGDNPLGQETAETEVVARGAAAPPAAGKFVLGGATLVVTVVPRTSDPADYEALAAGCAVDGEMRALVGEDDAGTRWYVTARLTQHVRSGAASKLTFDVPDRVWRSMTTQSDAWTVTASGQTHALTVDGTRAARPRFTFSPRNAKTGGFGYVRWVGVCNQTDAPMKYALDITSSAGRGLDTAALVSAGRMQADGDDLWVYVDGVPTSRWLVDMNTTATGVVVTLDLSPRVEAALKTAIAGSGTVTQIAVVATSANLTALKKMNAARNKIVMIDNEAFTFTGVDEKNYLLTGVQRAQRWTSMAAHAAGATVRWVEHDVYMLYGNATLDAPEEDVSRKPLWDLETSTNTSWVYGEFYDADNPGRPGAWVPARLASTGKLSGTYTATHGGSDNPASVMGMQALAYMASGAWKAETAQLEWRWIGAGATAVSAAGEKYMYAASWGTKAGLQKSTNGTAWTDVWNELKPTAAQTWQTWTRSGSGLSGTFGYLRFFSQVSLAAAANNEADLEVNAVTLTLDAAKTPLVWLGAEQDNYWMEMTIRCVETDEALTLRGVVPINATVAVDCDAKTVTLDGENAYYLLSLSSVRSTWLDLPPGTATIEIVDEGLTQVDVSVDYEERTV